MFDDMYAIEYTFYSIMIWTMYMYIYILHYTLIVHFWYDMIWFDIVNQYDMIIPQYTLS